MKQHNNDAIAWLIGGLVFVLVAMGWATSAESQQLGLRCVQHSVWLEHAEKRYGETLQSTGKMNDGGTLEMWANTDNGSWTLLLLPPEGHPLAGQACSIGAGTGYESVTAEGDLL